MRKFLIPCFGIALALIALPACSRANTTPATAPGAGLLPASVHGTAANKTPKKIAVVEVATPQPAARPGLRQCQTNRYLPQTRPPPCVARYYMNLPAPRVTASGAKAPRRGWR